MVYSCGARFNEDFYVKVDVDTEDPSAWVVTAIISEDGTPFTITGSVTWDESDGDGDGDGDSDGGLG